MYKRDKMKKFFKALFIVAIALLVCTSCFRKRKTAPGAPPAEKEYAREVPAALTPPAPPEWLYEKDAIHLRIKADSQLNLFQKTPHALVMCIYQLSSPNAFQELTGSEEGMSKLLECSRFDDSVASSRSIVVQPRQDLTKSLDRAEGAQYIAIAAGYYLFRKERAISREQ
jgi:type VI secretion system VasD/TssJ family lipoprotein